MYHDLKVDGVSLKGYKVYINGTEAYDSAERDVELIEIPGRNGAFALDKNRFKNITVQYNSGTFAENQPEFARKISDLRNFLASRKGYVRIEDDYNPEEYRMGLFTKGLEFDPVCYNMASEFPIEFNMKPQRFLKVGELPVAIASGDTLTNPTLFESNPLLMVRGYGFIKINNQQITIDNTVVGDTILLQPFSGGATKYADYGDGLINTGDIITVAQGSKATYTVKFKDSIDLLGVLINNITGGIAVIQSINYASKTVVLEAEFKKVNYTAGTNGSKAASFTANIQFSEDGLDQSINVTFTPRINYTANTRRITIYADGGSNLPSIVQSVGRNVRCQQVTAYSTVSTLGDPTYIDLEIGEAYKMVNGEAVSLNNSVSIGSTLPTLVPGLNTIRKATTITSLEIIPRWWRV